MSNNLDRAVSALFHLDPSCTREEWVRIGMGAKAAGVPFDDFDLWSGQASNYGGRAACMALWKSIDGNGGIGPGTLYAMAQERGWVDGSVAKRRQGHGPEARLCPTTSSYENKKAADVWASCDPANETHEYISRKQGTPEGVRMYPQSAPPLLIRNQNVAGFLVVPCYSENGTIQTLQFIPGKGGKLNLPGASFGNGYFALGSLEGAAKVFIVEGIGQAWAVREAVRCPAVVSFGAGRMATVAAALRKKYPLAQIVVLPDRGKEEQAQEIARSVNGQWCPLPQAMSSNEDVNDYMLAHGANALADLLEQAKCPPSRFNLLSGDELCNAPPMQWMVRGLLPLEGLAALFGPSGSGKSFLTLDIAASVAGGEHAWFGRRITQRPVTYVCLEGEQGMGKRVKAWSEHNGKPVPASLRFITQAFDLLNDEDVLELAKVLKAASGAFGLVILDTLSRAAPGVDENSSVEMGNIIAAAKRLQLLVEGLVLLVHHTGKDEAKGLRGHSSLHAALDSAIRVNKTDGRREWSVAKSKDDQTGEIYPFRLQIVPVGVDDEGEEITSCVVVTDDGTEAVKRAKLPQGGNQKLVLEALRPLFVTGKPGKAGAPPQRPCIELEAAIAAGACSLTCPSDKRTSRARDAITGLVGRGVLGCHEGWVWLA